MRVSCKSTAFYLLLFVFFAHYLTLCVGIDLLHDHEPDLEFHDNCPACQWLTLYQDDFSQASQMLNGLNDPFLLIGYEKCIQSFVLPSDSYRSSHFSRGPPLPA